MKNRYGFTKENVLDEPIDAQSPASMYLLRMKLAACDARRNKVIWLSIRDAWLSSLPTLTCVRCGKTNLDKDASANNAMLATIDHIVPVSRGGGFLDPENWQVMCSPCNNKKGNRLESELQRGSSKKRV